MDSSLLTGLVLALAAAAVSPWIDRFAMGRAMVQPLPIDESLERRAVELAATSGIGEADAARAAAWFCDSQRAASLLECATPEASSSRALAAALRDLETLYADRTEHTGACGYSPSDTTPFVVRNAPLPSARRSIAVTAAAGASGALVGCIDVGLAGSAAVLLLALAGWVVALVDRDTMYLDLRTWWSLSPLAMALAAHGQGGARLAVALIVAVTLWGALEVLNLAFRATTGADGIGGGDGMLVFPVSFVIVALTGSVIAAWWALLGAFLLAGLVVLPRALFGRRERVFALVPYLVTSWQLSLLAWSFGALP